MMNDLINGNNGFVKEMKTLSNLPYRSKPYSAKNWGHVRHTLCSYPSKIKPAIAYYLVKLFSGPADIILDPFSGVGTIPFEACLNKRKGIGIDLSPLAFHVTNGKIHNIDKSKVKEEIEKIRDKIEKTKDIELLDCEARTFYHPITYREILIARNYFLNNEIIPERSFVLSCVLHILHGNRPYALSRRSHNIIPISPKGDFVYKSLIKSLEEKSNRMLKRNLPIDFIDGDAFNGDVCNMKIESNSINRIITSPPFLGTTEFLRHNRIRLWFCGWDSDKIIKLKKKSHFLEFNGLQLYPKIFREFERVLTTDGLLVLHLGIYKNENMAASLIPIGEDHGFSLLGVINEDSTHLETHGRTDRGGTHTHQFLIMQKSVGNR